MKNSFLTLLCFVLVFFSTGNSYAQETSGDIFEQSMSDAITVGACGGIGAVLGLSTLSFVEEPGDHLKNIVVGGAIGIIIGVGVVAFNQANVSKVLIESGEAIIPTHNPGLTPSENPEMTTAMRNYWHQKNHYQINNGLGTQSNTSTPGVNFQFSF